VRPVTATAAVDLDNGSRGGGASGFTSPARRRCPVHRGVAGTGGNGQRRGDAIVALKVWINAFIPFEVSGYTRMLDHGRHAGRTAVPLPGPARIIPLNWKDWDAGYLTDQRSFSSEISASCRMQSAVEFTLEPTLTVAAKMHRSSGTTEVDMETGEQLGHAVADMSGCAFGPLQHGVTQGDRQYRVPLGSDFTVDYPPAAPPVHPQYRIDVIGQAGDPLVTAAADIDYRGTFAIVVDPEDARRGIVTFEGRIDLFPAFECYARLGETTKCLFRSPPPVGNTVLDLLGGARRAVGGTARFP
jgi:hypothetical protein